MGLHFETTVQANRQAMWQRGVRAVGSLLIAGGLVWAGMMGLAAMRPRPEPVYRPLFVSLHAELPGCILPVPVRIHLQRKPTPPVGYPLRPLGLAPKNKATPPAGLPDVNLPTLEFGDGLDFCWGVSSCRSFD